MQETTRLVSRVGGWGLALVIVCFCALPVARAQEAPEQGTEDTWGEKKPPEGYVKSKEPAKSESTYNWVQMGYAAIVVVAMGGIIIWLVRRSTREK